MPGKKNTTTQAEQDKVTTTQLLSDPGLPNNWIDRVQISARGDGICLLRFFTDLPEGVFEKTRIFMSLAQLKNMGDAINQVLSAQQDPALNNK